MKRITTTHLTKHLLTSVEYRARFPNALLTDPETSAKIARANTGKTRSAETCEKIAMAKREHYLDPELHRRVSEGTKAGMREPESWVKFQECLRTRDTSGFGTHFKSDLPETKAKMYTAERNEKVSVKKIEWWAGGRKGKRIEELWGEEKGKEIRKLKSEQTQGDKNPAYGKVYSHTGAGKLGYYKKKLFRGILEYSFYHHIDEQGLFDQLQYEPFAISYELNGRKRTYTPDFLIGERLIEIKPKYLVEEGKEKFLKKCEAARKHCESNGLWYEVLTERDFPQRTYAEAYADQNVRWVRR